MDDLPNRQPQPKPNPNPNPNPNSNPTDLAIDDLDLDPDLDLDSACSTPFVSAPSSPSRSFFFSAPSSPIHYLLLSSSSSSAPDADFDFAAHAHAVATMSSADELFLNGQIRPLQPHRHDEDHHPRGRDLSLRSRSVHRRARSLSPLRNAAFFWRPNQSPPNNNNGPNNDKDKPDPPEPSASRSSSSSSSASSASSSSNSGRIARRLSMLKDLLLRSKSEGRSATGNAKDKFWHTARSSSPAPAPATAPSVAGDSKGKERAAVNGRRKRGGASASAHERHYTANRAHAEEMRRRTFLPYRQGLLGCLGFSSRGYGAVNGLARSLHSVSSR